MLRAGEVQGVPSGSTGKQHWQADQEKWCVCLKGAGPVRWKMSLGNIQLVSLTEAQPLVRRIYPSYVRLNSLCPRKCGDNRISNFVRFNQCFRIDPSYALHYLFLPDSPLTSDYSDCSALLCCPNMCYKCLWLTTSLACFKSSEFWCALVSYTLCRTCLNVKHKRCLLWTGSLQKQIIGVLMKLFPRERLIWFLLFM